MADVSDKMDDFFAKKDKKKGKSKKPAAFLTSEELAKQLEQSAKEREQSKKLPAKIEEEAEQQIAKQLNDEEWNSFEEEKPTDLSNLKLKTLTLTEEQENNQNAGIDYDNDNSQTAGDNSENPWSKAGSAPAPVAAVAKPAAVQQKTGIYQPPSMMMMSGSAQKARFNKKNAPDLQNKEFFPSLGTEKPAAPQIAKRDGFTEVQHGNKLQTANAGTVPVSLGNAYSSLLSDSLDS